MSDENKEKELSLNQWERYLSKLEVEQIEETLADDIMIEELKEKDYKEQFTDLIGQNYCKKREQNILIAMRCLSPRQRQVIHLLFWENYTVEETAVHLGIRHSSVINLRSRALKKLRNIFSAVQNEIEEKYLKLVS